MYRQGKFDVDYLNETEVGKVSNKPRAAIKLKDYSIANQFKKAIFRKNSNDNLNMIKQIQENR